MSRPQRITNEVIYEAAHKIIMQHGPASLTFKTLSDATGLVPAALVRRFKSKQQLFVEVDSHCLETAADTLADAAKRFDSTLDAIVHGLSSEMKFATSPNTYINGLAFLLKGLDNSELYGNYQAAFERQKRDIHRLLEKAKIQKELAQDVDCAELTRLLQITQQGACHIWIMTQQEPIGMCIERYLRISLRAYTVDS